MPSDELPIHDSLYGTAWTEDRTVALTAQCGSFRSDRHRQPTSALQLYRDFVLFNGICEVGGCGMLSFCYFRPVTRNRARRRVAAKVDAIQSNLRL